MPVLTLKHLARAVDLSPFKTRTLLRQKFGLAPGKRWRWVNESDKDWKRKVAYLNKVKSNAG
jgi:hypothetical protein